MTVGVTIGKFNPPHLGHLYMITEAAKLVDKLYVILCHKPEQTFKASQRASWIEQSAPPGVEVLTTLDDLPEEPEPWAWRARKMTGYHSFGAPDVVFTSEEYGKAWGDIIGAGQVVIDMDREAFPISATELREDLKTHFRWLIPAARRELSKRVVLIGPESSGKTVMAKDLAEKLGTVWVPEYGRTYWDGRLHLDGWDEGEFRHIVEMQRKLEHELALKSTGVVVNDTDALVTEIWAKRYLGEDFDFSPRVPDSYLVCTPDFEWVQDGTRESENERVWMGSKMEERARGFTWRVKVLRGPHEKRLDLASMYVDNLATWPILT